MRKFLCNLAIKILRKYKRSVILNYQIRGDIRPIHNKPILIDNHIIGKLYVSDSGNEFEDYR